MIILIYIDKSRGKEVTSLTGVIVLLVCLFWIVGGMLFGRRLLEPSLSTLAEKLFVAMYIVILVASQIGVFLTPTDSPSHVQFYLTGRMMMSGAALWLGGLYLKQALMARGKHSAVPPPCEQE